MRCYTFDNNNIYTGFVDSQDEVLNSTLVEPESNLHTEWNGSVWIIEIQAPETFEDNRTAKILSARDYFDAHFEKETWETQRHEWVEYEKDNLVSTPYCDMLASTRGIPKEYLMQRIGENVVSYANIQGQLHALEDMINGVTTQEQLDQIVW